MLRVVRICISMHKSGIRFQGGQWRTKRRLRHFPPQALQAGAVSVANSLTPDAAKALPGDLAHFCLNGITALGRAPSCVLAVSWPDSASRKKRGDTFQR